MKTLTTFIFTIFLFQICLSQTVDTIRIYDYFKPGDSWKLKIKSNKTFALYTNNFFSKDEMTSAGTCKIGDTTIQFLCDTAKLKNKQLVRAKFRQFSNIPFIPAVIRSQNKITSLYREISTTNQKTVQ